MTDPFIAARGKSSWHLLHVARESSRFKRACKIKLWPILGSCPHEPESCGQFAARKSSFDWRITVVGNLR
jgi:hypothetical protein